jgi:RHS repeat-associated protein
MSFDIIREQESFADGYFTNTSDTYVDWQASGEESSSRYRYIGEEAGSSGLSPASGENQANSQSLIPGNFHANNGENQANSSGGNSGNGEVQTGSSGSNSGNFRANSNADYRLVSPNRSRNSVTLFAKGEAVATNKNSYSTTTTSTSSGNRSGTTSASTKRSYFGTDMIGSVRSATHDDGLNANYYDYDVFGKPFGETSDYGYVGKPYDPVTGLSNYGYRDYSPKTARFTTVDPIRDGHNWYAYCSNDPVNFVDLWGLEINSLMSFYKMNDERWRKEPVNNIPGEYNTLGQQGCAIALVSNFGENEYGNKITPQDLNKNPTSFSKNDSINLNWQGAGKNLGLKITRSDLDGKLPAQIMLDKAVLSAQKMYVGVQVPVTTKAGVVSHWVGVDGQPVVINNETYLNVSGTSINDGKNRIVNENWHYDAETGQLYVKKSAVTGVVTAVPEAAIMVPDIKINNSNKNK